MRLDCKNGSSVDVVSGVPKGSVLGSLLLKLFTSELFHIIGKPIVEYANDTTINAIIP